MLSYVGIYSNQEMKNKTINESDLIPKNMYHSGIATQFVTQRIPNVNRDFSIEQKIKRMSPLPQERYSQLPNNFVYALPSLSNNDYQIPHRSNQQPSSGYDTLKTLHELIFRIDKLEGRVDKTQKLQAKVDKLEKNVQKLQGKYQNMCKSQENSRGKQNMMNSDNHHKIIDEELRGRVKDFITRQELQKQLVGLDSAFKTLINGMRSTLSLEVGDMHAKNKKRFIEIMASQLNQKLEAFRGNFLKEWHSQLQIIVKDTWSKEIINKNVMGISRQKFVGTAIPINLRQQLTIMKQGAPKQIAISNTLYYLDNQGFLLNSNFYYLLDRNNSQIKLSQDHIQSLKKQGLLIGISGNKQNMKLGIVIREGQGNIIS